MQLKTPKSLKTGHANLYIDIEAIANINDEIGKKAKELADALFQHFKKEEEFALPPLSLLLMLAEGRWEVDEKLAIEMSDKLRDNLLEMKKEHQEINKIVEEFKILAQKENHAKALHFARDLTMHIDIEDQVLYPATILIGHYLKNMRKNQL